MAKAFHLHNSGREVDIPSNELVTINLFLPSYAFISFINNDLSGRWYEGYLAFQMHVSY